MRRTKKEYMAFAALLRPSGNVSPEQMNHLTEFCSAIADRLALRDSEFNRAEWLNYVLGKQNILAGVSETDKQDLIDAAKSMYQTDAIRIDEDPVIVQGKNGSWVSAAVWVPSD